MADIIIVINDMWTAIQLERFPYSTWKSFQVDGSAHIINYNDDFAHNIFDVNLPLMDDNDQQAKKRKSSESSLIPRQSHMTYEGSTRALSDPTARKHFLPIMNGKNRSMNQYLKTFFTVTKHRLGKV